MGAREEPEQGKNPHVRLSHGRLVGWSVSMRLQFPSMLQSELFFSHLPAHLSQESSPRLTQQLRVIMAHLNVVEVQGVH